MSGKGTRDIDKECPICGGIIWGRGIKVLIEGARMTVCQVCAQHGQKVVKKNQTQLKKVQSKRTSNRSLPKYKKFPVDELEIVDDYNIRIRKIRQKLKLNQDQFANKLNEKPSLLRRIESKKTKPTLKLAKKIEKVYNIKLIKTSETMDVSPQVNGFMKKKSGSSLGDIAFIKKKK